MLEGHHEITVAVVRVIEMLGVAIIAAGTILTLAIFLYRLVSSSDRMKAYGQFRTGLGRAILLGLEFLVAADIINTITVDLTLESIASLALIVVIRTFLSWTIELEIEGRWPWQREQGESRS